MNYVMLPTKELAKHTKMVQELNKRYGNLDTIRLQCTHDIPRLGRTYRWVKDKSGIVDTIISNFKATNPEECSDKDYTPPKPRWYKGDYKYILRTQIQVALLTTGDRNGQV